MASIQKSNSGKLYIVKNVYDKDSKRKQAWIPVSEPTNEAKIQLQQKQCQIEELSNRFLYPDKRTLEEYLAYWVKHYGRKKWAPATYHSNQLDIENHIIPHIGQNLLTNINAKDIEFCIEQVKNTKANKGNKPPEAQPFLDVYKRQAVGRALATAGFGTQFVPPLKEQEGIVDSPVRWKPVPLKKESFPPPTSPESQTIADNIPQVESNEEEITQVTPDMSVTAIVKNLSVKDALNVVIDSGKNEGKTFREVVKTRPQALHWYYRDYSGKNNLIRAAAKRLLDEAQRQQQQRQSV